MWPLLCMAALAQDEAATPTTEAPPEPPPLTTAGELRFIGSLPPDFPVDAEGTQVGQGPVLDSRLRASLDYRTGRLRLGTEWDLFTGQLAGDTWDLPTGIDERNRDTRTALTLQGVVPRRANVGLRTGAFDLEAGLTTSRWGLGLLANDGAQDPLFGRADAGDRVVRVRLTTAPFGDRQSPTPLFLTLAADGVVADDLARLSNQQRAFQAIASALYAHPEGRQLGAYVVGRTQRELATDRRTDVVVADVFGQLPVAVGAGTLWLAAEAATFLGRTDRALSYNAPDGLGVGAAAVVAHSRLALADDAVNLHLRAGWASGDGDPDDGVIRDFTADPNLDVGMVLFDELGGAIETGTVRLLTDPQYSAEAPDGVDALATEGSWRRSAYLQPAVQIAPIEALDVRVGAVLAWSTGPIAQPFYSFRNGGTPTNHIDQPTAGRALGTELDWAIRLHADQREQWRLRPDLWIQGGHALLSDNQRGPDMPSRLDLVLATARMRW
ncbi:MAG: hypothetical protein KTR31_14300 [Myxococcales bacterium]|nr:hypothetical protein [Myxococcales bacterium]